LISEEAARTEYPMSPEELAKFLGLSRTRTYELLSAGIIPSVHIGRLRRVRRTDVDRFVESRLE
jgi:excisionase family DNA binding protein